MHPPLCLKDEDLAQMNQQKTEGKPGKRSKPRVLRLSMVLAPRARGLFQHPHLFRSLEVFQLKDRSGKAKSTLASQRVSAACRKMLGLTSSLIWPWGITYGSILGWMNIHLPPILSQGCRVLTHSHMSKTSVSPAETNSRIEVGAFL